MKLVTKCYSCGGEIIFADGSNTVQCEYCGRMNARPKSELNELNRMKHANERLSFGEFEEAERVYREVLQRTPDEHEARWGLLLCRYGVRYVEDVKTGQRLPTCRKSLPTSFCAEPDFRLACEAAPADVRADYEKDGRYIDDIQKEIRRLKVSGVQYDIFICNKETGENKERTADSLYAQDLYKTLLQHGFSVFYARESLKDCLGANYEAAIYCALETSRVMLTISTKPEYLESAWVKSEWMRYLEHIDRGERKLLIPLYRDYSPDLLPAAFTSRFIQGLDMSPFSFMFDLEAFLTRTLRRADDASRTDRLLDRGFRELLDGDFAAARRCFEDVLDNDYECARANLGMAMVELKAKDEASLREICIARGDWSDVKYLRRAEEFGDEPIKAIFDDVRKLKQDEQARRRAEAGRLEAERAAAAEAARREKEEAQLRQQEDERVRQENARRDMERVRLEAERRRTGSASEGAQSDEETRSRSELSEAAKRIRREAEACFKGNEEAKASDFRYRISPAGVTITKYIGRAAHVIVPREIDGRPVVKIGAEAFCGRKKLMSDGYVANTSLTAVKLSEWVSTIEANAFSCCINLECIVMDGVFQIGEGAFEGCASLKKVCIPDKLTEIPYRCFADSGVEEVIMPDGVARIGLWAFGLCKKLAKIVLPESVRRIHDSCFSNSGIQEMRIPGGVEYIGENAFENCGELKKVIIESGIRTISAGCFQKTGLEEIQLPDSLVKIGSRAFSQCEALRKIYIPQGVEELGVDCFSRAGIEEIYLPESVRRVESCAFAYCANLKKVYVSRGVTEIGYSCFSHTSVEEIYLPDSVAHLQEQTFAYCEKLKSICLPEGLLGLLEGCFSYSGLEEIIIPDSVEKMGGSVFKDCKRLSSAVLSGRLKEIPENAFDGCVNLKRIGIPESVRTIGSMAFACCKSLTEVQFSQELKRIRRNAFAGCDNLRQISVGRRVKVEEQENSFMEIRRLG